ncbi:electron transport complex protein RnfD [Fervidobacterium changbaicum]|uniref:Ion-translocating oxidoreductase complex subunit D n=1 Tax=Fervidobacterium changbaicum TaxID=310769 RepID=A0ABX5QTH9_9BACT|nr:RnfABCDGE type electron transport complex subunit D [Fervidobacterium changbaicum]QAV33841.1 RnfABCDGE type electron transport complex subunit D [Fervidobacterium changbaicum]SDH45094.1 electron transport complex protein RnfD [Fervidobacterium changbaicum]
MKNVKLLTSPAPHVRTQDSTRKVMIDVIIALVPAVIAGTFFFGLYALLLSIIGMVSAELVELFIMRVLRKDKSFLPNGSAAVTGLLLALNLSVATPWWVLIIGVVFAIAIVKHAFGGLGQNIFNPALAARVFLLVSFPTAMTTWYRPIASFTGWYTDAQTTATPLAILKLQGFSKVMADTNYLDLAFGNIGGCIGETSAVLLFIGFLYLVFRKRVKIVIPVTYIGTVLLIASIFYAVNPERFGSPLFHMLAGGLMLGALFMATDMVTSPMTIKGQFIFGLGCGIVTMLIRYFGGYPEGVSLSILLMNSLVPIIDRHTQPRIFGRRKG